MQTSIRALITIIYISMICSCRKFIEVPPPSTLTLSQYVFSSDQSVNAAALHMYTTMLETSSLPYLLCVYPGIAADELTSSSSVTGVQQIYKNSMLPDNTSSKTIWDAGYKIIYEANNLIEGLTTSKNISETVKNQLIGEALFMRAFWHFYLTNIFGDIPIVTTTDYIANNTLYRDSSKKVFLQIETDLLAAKNLLNEKYVTSNSVTVGTERVRPNKYAALALLSRLHLYTNNYLSAEKYASEIIEKKDLYDTTQLDKVFLANSKESIFQLMTTTPNLGNINTLEGRYFILTAKPATGSFNSSFLTKSLFNTFEAGDIRKSKWISKFTDAATSTIYYYPFKYKTRTSAIITEYSTVLRLAEIYLIRAESRVHNGNLLGAISDVDILRTRAGLKSITTVIPTASDEHVLTAILHERQVELFTEFGHRWLDLKRTNAIDNVMSIEAGAKSSIWQKEASLWPIPQSEIDKNTHLSQNPGYN